MRRVTSSLIAVAVLAGTALVAAPSANAVQAAVGTCYDYSISEAVGISNAAVAVSCAKPHTAETFYVGSFSDSLGDPNKASESARLSLTYTKCGVKALNAFLGMQGRTLPSRFAAFPYFPTTAEYKAGERWVRCDVVLRSGTGLESVKGSVANIGDAKKFNYCTPGALPNWRKLSAEVCNEDSTAKTWILIDRPELGGANASYPAGIANKAEAKCRAKRDEFAGIAKRPRYYYTYPGSLEWTAGAHTSNCFVPLQQYVDSLNPSTSTPASVGDCFNYPLSASTRLVQTVPAVACTQPHTAQTFATPALPASVGDPTKASENQRQAAIQQECTRTKLLEFLGISESTPLRFDILGFFPGSGDYANGVRTFHCDVVFLDGKGLAPLTQDMPSFAQAASPIDLQYCTPSTGYGKTPGTTVQVARSCNQTEVKKFWIDVRQAELVSSKSAPSTSTINKIAKKLCASVKTEFKGVAKKPSWYYTYPDATAWANGNRTARCWVPLKQYNDTINPPAPAQAPAPAPAPVPDATSTATTDATATPAA